VLCSFVAVVGIAWALEDGCLLLEELRKCFCGGCDMYSKKNLQKRRDIVAQLRQEFPDDMLRKMTYEERYNVRMVRAEQLCKEARKQGYRLSRSQGSHDFNAALTVVFESD
jgi:hypothetical protein